MMTSIPLHNLRRRPDRTPLLHNDSLTPKASTTPKRTKPRRRFRHAGSIPYLNRFIGAICVSSGLVILFRMLLLSKAGGRRHLSGRNGGGIIFPWSASVNRQRNNLFHPPPLELLDDEPHYLLNGSDNDAYGYLDLTIPASFRDEPARTIPDDDYDRYELYRDELMETMNTAEPIIMKEYWHNDELVGDKNRTCYRDNWSRKFYPVCNQFHELHMEVPWGRRDDPEKSILQDYDYLLKAKGSFVHVWLMARPSIPKEFLVIKRFKLSDKGNHKLGTEDIARSQQEAVILEQLSENERFIDIYGYCATSTLLEGAKGELAEEVMPAGGFVSQEVLDTFQKDDVMPLNALTLTEKIDTAIIMAEAMAYLHGFKGGAIAHGDIYPSQWLRTYDGKLKLNDFNAAVVPEWDPVKQNYCTFERCYLNWNRAPEDLTCGQWPCDLGIDTYCMGNNIYTLLTGLWSFYWAMDDEPAVIQSVLYGNRTYIDPRYRSRSMVERNLVELMEYTWIANIQQRISIFDVLRGLREIKRLYEIELASKNDGSLSRA
jgi:hypothetical protein